MTLPSALPASNDQPADLSTTDITSDDELVRFVAREGWLLWGDDGLPKMQSVGIPDPDIKGEKGRSVSVTRLRAANRDFLSWRATARNRQPEWRDDPVYAIAKVAELDKVRDRLDRPELDLRLDIVHDWLGQNENHVSIVRKADNIKRIADKRTREDVLTWQLLRVAIADAFSTITHCSGAAVLPLSRK